MKKRFSEEEIIRILRAAEMQQSPIRDLCRERGISEQTFYRWRNRYGGLQVDEAVRLRQLERENKRLKKLVAERDLEIEFMKEVVSKKW